MCYSFRLTARVLLYAPSHRQDSTYHGLCYTSRGALAGTRNSSMGPPDFWKCCIKDWVHLNLQSNKILVGRIQPIPLTTSRPLRGDREETRCHHYIDYSFVYLMFYLMTHSTHPLSYFSFQPVFHDWCNKGRGMCYLSVGLCI